MSIARQDHDLRKMKVFRRRNITHCFNFVFALLSSKFSQKLTLVPLFVMCFMQGFCLIFPKGDEASCNAAAVYPKLFEEKRLGIDAWKSHCGETIGECFAKCLYIVSCRSFAVVKTRECNSQCLFYNETTINQDSFVRDDTASYYFLESRTCCNGSCLNQGLCDSKSCTCQCAKGYSSKDCICPTKNLSREFSSSGKQMKGDVVQITSEDQTWAIDKNENISIYNQEGNNWTILSQNNLPLTHVSIGKSGIWGVNKAHHVFYRSDSSWTPFIGDIAKQIDSGNFGAVYLVNSVNVIYCRTGITPGTPSGTGFQQVPGYLAKYVSCGDYGCWAIKPDNSVSFRTGITAKNCAGNSWLDVDGHFIQLDAGFTGSVYAISQDYGLYIRVGICAVNPTGHKWMKAKEGRFKHVAVGNTNLFAIAENGTIIVFS